MVSGAVIAGIGATEGLLPHAFDKWFGLSGNWALLIGGFALVVTLLLNPQGITGTAYLKKQQKMKRQAAGQPKHANPLHVLRQKARRNGLRTAAR